MKNVIVSMSVLLIIFIGSSCVSKKKFVEMQNGRLKAEKEVSSLTETTNSLSARIKTMISDFENMKTELMESNAIKDQYIDSLNRKIAGLSNNLKKQDESLSETEFTLDFEKRRLTNALTEREKQIKQMEMQLAGLQIDIKNKTTEIDEKNFDLKVAQDQIALLESGKKTTEQNLAELQEKMNNANNEIARLKTESKKKDETILRLENNVKLLKKEMEK